MDDIKKAMIEAIPYYQTSPFVPFILDDDDNTTDDVIGFDNTEEAKQRLIQLVDCLFGRNGVINEYNLHPKGLKKPNTKPIDKTIEILKSIGFGDIGNNGQRDQIFLTEKTRHGFTLTDVINALEKVKGQLDEVDGNTKILTPYLSMENHFYMRKDKIENQIKRVLKPMNPTDKDIELFINKLFSFYGVS